MAWRLYSIHPVCKESLILYNNNKNRLASLTWKCTIQRQKMGHCLKYCMISDNYVNSIKLSCVMCLVEVKCGVTGMNYKTRPRAKVVISYTCSQIQFAKRFQTKRVAVTLFISINHTSPISSV